MDSTKLEELLGDFWSSLDGIREEIAEEAARDDAAGAGDMTLDRLKYYRSRVEDLKEELHLVIGDINYAIRGY